MSTYWEKLKDPRWQRLRLEMFNRAGWACENCGSKSDTLHLHHGYYERGKDPWDYLQESLHVLCENCHLSAGESLANVHYAIAECPIDSLDAMLDLVCRAAYLIRYGTARQFDDVELLLLQFAGRDVPVTPDSVAETLKHLIDCLANEANSRKATHEQEH